MAATHTWQVLLSLLALLTSSYAARARFEASGSQMSSHKPDIPEWLASMKYIIRLAHIFSSEDEDRQGEDKPKSYVSNYTIGKGGVMITPDHIETSTKYFESESDLHLESDRAFVDFKDVRVSLRIYIKHMSFLSGSNNYIDAKLAGGLRAGWALKSGMVESGTWAPMCSCDGSAQGLQGLDGDAEFHLSDVYTESMIKSLFPDPKAIVQDIICAEVKLVLKTHQDVYLEKMKRFYQMRKFWQKEKGFGPPGSGLLFVERYTWHYTPPRNLGLDCGKFGCRGGECPYCGGGFCCKKGSFRGGCDGSRGNISQHVCTVAPKKATAFLNAGAECWNAADCRSGSCGFCGLGSCCRKGWASGGCDGNVGGLNRHECVVSSTEVRS